MSGHWGAAISGQTCPSYKADRRGSGGGVASTSHMARRIRAGSSSISRVVPSVVVTNRSALSRSVRHGAP